MESSDAWIGWLSSGILLATLAKQLHKQWSEKTSQGVSRWLFLGQLAAELGFVIYSWRVKSWVFVATNTLLIIENLLGLAIVLHHRRTQARNPAKLALKSVA